MNSVSQKCTTFYMYEDFSETSKNATELTDSSERNPEQNQ